MTNQIKYKWASLGTGVIANELAQALEALGGKLYSVANRTYDKGVAFAEKYGIEKVYEEIDQVFEDPEVDIIYISTPHNTHIQFLRKALAAGKHVLCEKSITLNSEELEEAMQKVMDAYAGGISSHYQFNENCLNLAKEKINNLITLSGQLSAQDYHELMFYYELKERLTICLTLIEHLKARKQTRWHSFDENLDYPKKSGDWLKYVNSKMEDGKITVFTRKLVGREEHYEHHDESGAL